MEAIAGLSLAANIFQVIDFSHKLITAAVESYKFGAPKNLQTLDQVAVELKGANLSLDETIAVATDGSSASPNDQAILSLAKESNALANEFLMKVDFSPKGNKFRSFCDGIKAVWNRDKIQEKKDRLNELRDLIQYRIIVSLRSLADEHTSQLAGLDTKTSEILATIVASNASFKSDLQQVLSNLHVNDRVGAQRHHELLAAIRSNSHIYQQFPDRIPKPMDKDLWTGDEEKTVAKKTADVLDWLRFARMDARREAISRHHAQTFEWLYEEVSVGANSNDTFSRWLREDSGIYWIKGKAGSGKSTLMKMISEDSRTRRLLKQWAQGKELLFSSFYFWFQGNEMQKSQTGLLRAVLYDILITKPELVRAAFPGWQDRFALSEPILEDVKPALARILKESSFQGHSVCIFIDGLDEYEGDGISMTDLAEYLRELSQAPNVKILVSSRPLQPFEEGFADLPQLPLHSLTYEDIRKVVTESLEKHPRMAFLMQSNPKRAAKLIEDISEKSSGVFLWVILAVKAIKDGFQNHDGIEELEKRLLELPPELDDMFVHILQRIPSRYKGNALILLEVIRQWFSILSRPMPALAFLFAFESKRHSVLEDYAIGRPEEAVMIAYKEDLLVKLRTRTLGLLESAPDGVQFLHRSVLEFLHNSPNWRTSLGDCPSEFDVNMAIAEGLIVSLKMEEFEWAEIQTEYDKKMGSIPRKSVQKMMLFLKFGTHVTEERRIKALNRLDLTMHTHHVQKKLSKTKEKAGNWPDEILEDRDNDNRRRIGYWKSTFFAFTVLHGCEYYVRHVLTLSNWRLPLKKGRPLLDCAIFLSQNLYRDVDRNSCANPSIVEMLLRAGADPNETFEDSTPWFNAVRALRDFPAYQQSKFTLERLHYHSILLQIMKHLIVHGADRTAYIPMKMTDVMKGKDEEQETAADVLRRYLKKDCPCKGWESQNSHPVISCRSPDGVQIRTKVNELLEFIEHSSIARFENRNDAFKSDVVDDDATLVGKPRRRERMSKWFARMAGSDS